MNSKRSFYSRLFSLAIPIIAQTFISSSLNLLDVLMIGQLGETSVASVGLANQVFFLLQFLLFGINSGAAVFTAQLWGKGDVPNIRRVLGIGLTMGVSGGLLFGAIALLAPETALSIYTQDPAVKELGSSYLRTVGYSYPLMALTFGYASVLRSTGNVRPPMMVSIIALSIKTMLNYLLIFGNLGFPELGVQGAALSTAIARTLECIMMLSYTYIKRLPTAGTPRELFSFERKFVWTYLKIAFPVVINEVLWSMGISAYNAVYGHIGTEAIAAINIASTIESLAFVIFIGISDATGILVGNQIGAKDEPGAFETAGRSIRLAVLGAMLMGGVIFVISGPMLTLYNVAPEVKLFARSILTIQACLLWVRVSNMTLIVGVLRSGGDTRFSMFLDGVMMWIVGVPSALLGAFVFHLPVYWVYLMVMSEELLKFVLSLLRYRSKKWIHNVSQAV